MADLPPFEYSALSAREIRILVPDDMQPTSGLSWSLRKASIDDQGLYFTALSYAWACHTHPDTFPISCNGRQLRVHYNLYSALPFLARRYNNDDLLATPYWVDAICINQLDDEEKVSQIRLMNMIYRQADRVLVWLGLALKPQWQNLIPRAIELLPLLIKEFARSRHPGPGARLTPNFMVDRELAYLGRDGWEAILHLLRNTYFRRVWMVQEVALAKDLVFLCGDHEIESKLMEEAVSDSSHITRWTLYDLATGKPMRIQAEYHDDNIVFAIRNVVNYDGEEGNAHQTIRIANMLDDQACFAPQDRVLGILGMVQEEFGSASEGLHTFTSIADLYTRFSTLLFEASGLTRMQWWYYMSMAFRKNRIEGLPSWVPDLHHNDTKDKRHLFDSMIAARVYSDPPWQASTKPRKAAHGPRPGEIMLRGRILDEVTLVHPEVPYGFPDHTDPPQATGMMWLAAVVALIQWESELSAASLQAVSSPGADRAEAHQQRISDDAYWRTLLADLHTDVLTGTHLTQQTWRQFQQQGQRLLRLVPRLEQFKRYVKQPNLRCLLTSSSETRTDPWELPDWTDSDEDLATMNCFRDSKHPVAMFMLKLTFTRDHQMISRGGLGLRVLVCSLVMWCVCLMILFRRSC